MLEAIKKELFKEKTFKSRHWNIFRKHYETLNFNKNEILTQFEQVEKYLYFIVEGGVRVYYPAVDKEVNTWFGFENQFVSSYTSFLTQEPSKQILAAIEDTAVIRINYDSMQKLNQYREGNRTSRLNVERLFIDKCDREASLLMDSPDERYNNFVNVHKDWLQRIPQHHIASYLGMSPETLSRVKKRNLK